MPFLAQMLTVVGPENDDRVVGVRTDFQRVQQLARLGVNKGYAGQIRARHLLPIIWPDVEHVPMIAPLDGALRHRFAVERDVIHFIPGHLGNDNVLQRIQIEELFRRGVGNVWSDESDREEKGLFVLLLQALDRPSGNLFVRHAFRRHVGLLQGTPAQRLSIHTLLILLIDRTAVRREWIKVSSAFALVAVTASSEFLGPFVFGTRLRPVVVAGNVTRALVEDLSGGERLVTVPLEMGGQWGHAVQGPFVIGALLGGVGIPTGGGRPKSAHQRVSRGGADRCRAMRIAEIHALCDQPIEIGCLGLGVAAQRLDPVVQIVNGEKQHIGFGAFRGRACGRLEQRFRFFVDLALRPGLACLSVHLVKETQHQCVQFVDLLRPTAEKIALFIRALRKVEELQLILGPGLHELVIIENQGRFRGTGHGLMKKQKRLATGHPTLTAVEHDRSHAASVQGLGQC